MRAWKTAALLLLVAVGTNVEFMTTVLAHETEEEHSHESSSSSSSSTTSSASSSQESGLVTSSKLQIHVSG